jgi:hypothetical protein
MARTLAPADPSHLQATGPARTFELGPYRYEISAEPRGRGIAAGGGAPGGGTGAAAPPAAAPGLGFTVRDGARSLSAPLEWVFGAGETGYTYLWQQDGAFYESRFSHFPALAALAATPGRLAGLPDSLAMALGHRLSAKEARGCFSCHATALLAAEPFDPRTLIPGVTCEGCHGPGADHLALEGSSLGGAGAIFDPGRLDPDGLADFCGACHGTFWDIELGPAKGLATVRSPGYRLVKSRCWGAGGEARLSCLACHDPHGRLEHEPAAYDAACGACHGAGGPHRQASPRRPLPCPVGSERCVACHMAKVELPEVHVTSTDHWIRVVRPGEPFPD